MPSTNPTPALRTSASAAQQLPPRTGTTGIANAPRRKVNPGVVAANDRGTNDNTPDTNRAMAGGSDRLLRSQSKTAQGGPTGGAPASRSQQNWYWWGDLACIVFVSGGTSGRFLLGLRWCERFILFVLLVLYWAGENAFKSKLYFDFVGLESAWRGFRRVVHHAFNLVILFDSTTLHISLSLLSLHTHGFLNRVSQSCFFFFISLLLVLFVGCYYCLARIVVLVYQALFPTSMYR